MPAKNGIESQYEKVGVLTIMAPNTIPGLREILPAPMIINQAERNALHRPEQLAERAGVPDNGLPVARGHWPMREFVQLVEELSATGVICRFIELHREDGGHRTKLEIRPAVIERVEAAKEDPAGLVRPAALIEALKGIDKAEEVGFQMWNNPTPDGRRLNVVCHLTPDLRRPEFRGKRECNFSVEGSYLLLDQNATLVEVVEMPRADPAAKAGRGGEIPART